MLKGGTEHHWGQACHQPRAPNVTRVTIASSSPPFSFQQPGLLSQLFIHPASQLPVLRNRLEMWSQLRKAAAISWKEAPSLESGESALGLPGQRPEGTCGQQHGLLQGWLILLAIGTPLSPVTEVMSENGITGWYHGENRWGPWGQGLGQAVMSAQPSGTRSFPVTVNQHKQNSKHKGFLLPLPSEKPELLRKGNSTR